MDSHSVRRGRCGKPSLQTKDGFQAAFRLENAVGSCRGIYINPLGNTPQHGHGVSSFYGERHGHILPKLRRTVERLSPPER